MSMSFFHTVLAEPLYNLLVWIYNILPVQDMGVAIILLTLIIKGVLWPLTGKSLQGQKAMQSLQPKLEALKAKYKDDKEALSREMIALYKEEKVNPASSCLPLLIQLPILIALYRVLFDGLNNTGTYQLYPFVSDPGQVNALFLGLLDLSHPAIWLAVLAGIAQFFQAKMLQVRRPVPAVRGEEGTKDEDMMASMNTSMLYLMPLMTVFIGAKLPGGLALYWLVVTLLSIWQQWSIFHARPSEASKI